MDNLSFKNKIPNILTIFRILLVPIIIVLILVSNKQILYTINISFENHSIIYVNLNLFIAGILFIISSITDFLDGFLARKWKVVSDFGKLWDPLADKILVNSVLFSLSGIGLIPIWIPILVLIRDIVMDGVRINCIHKNIIIPANIFGKIKTFVLMISVIIIFFFSTTIQSTYYWAIQLLLLYVSLFFTYFSLFIYLFQFYRKNKNDKIHS